jgi:hypothetical protein
MTDKTSQSKMDTDQKEPAGAITAHLSLSLMRRILQEPLLHFLLLGALLFLVFHFTGNRPADSKTEVVVTPGQVAALSAGFTRTWQRPPSAGELEGLIEDQFRAEIYSREALALGLDRDDLIIRNRLRTKLEMVTEDVIGQIDPTDDQLREYLNQHPEAFRREAQCAFRQIYFSSERRGARAHADARAELPQALLWFNVGVELGQLSFVVAALSLRRAFRVLQMKWPAIVARIPGYTVGVCGAYWFMQRTVMIFR